MSGQVVRNGQAGAPEGGPAGGPASLPSGARRGRRHARPQRGFFAELPVLMVIAFVLALLLKTFLVQAFYIPSSSMEPTLDVGDRVLVNKLSYTWREPRRGEVVVFSDDSHGVFPAAGQDPVRDFLSWLGQGLGLGVGPDQDFIKRIIALPGETVTMRDGIVTVDGRALDEATLQEGGYLKAQDMLDFGPLEVPDGHFFMLGDNRPNSADSRSSMGTIARDEIVGRAFVIIWPLSRIDSLPIADYAGVPGALLDPPAATVAP